MAALLAGSIFGLWLSLDPTGLNAAAYVSLQQQAIRTLNVAMPVLGGLTMLLTIAFTILSRRDGPRFIVLVVATLCLLGAGLITRFLNQPINDIVMTWSPTAPPSDWTQLRDQWWHWHVARMGLSLVALCLLIASVLKPSRV